jgi:hypothetical protein
MTRAKLFPINIVDINLEGSLVIIESIFGISPFCFFSISRFSLFDETYAISIPEKKAEQRRLSKIII